TTFLASALLLSKTKVFRTSWKFCRSISFGYSTLMALIRPSSKAKHFKSVAACSQFNGRAVAKFSMQVSLPCSKGSCLSPFRSLSKSAAGRAVWGCVGLAWARSSERSRARNSARFKISPMLSRIALSPIFRASVRASRKSPMIRSTSFLACSGVIPPLFLGGGPGLPARDRRHRGSHGDHDGGACRRRGASHLHGVFLVRGIVQAHCGARCPAAPGCPARIPHRPSPTHYKQAVI